MDAAQKLASDIAEKQGRRPHKVGRDWRVLCPHHEMDGGNHKPSLAIWPTSENNYAVKCMTGCSSSDVWRGLRALGIKGSQRGGSTALDRVKAAQARERHRVDQLMKVQEILSESTSPATAGPIEWYLRARDLYPLPESTLNTILQTPDPVWTMTKGFTLGGVICDMTTLRAERPKAVGLQLLSLYDDGVPRLVQGTGKKFRSIIGLSKGHAVPYGVPGPQLVVAEGIESMLAAMKLLEIPFGAATLASTNMQFLAIPEYVREVVIAADNDSPGMEAAAALMNDLGHVGIRCHIERWGEPGSGHDAADELMRGSSAA